MSAWISFCNQARHRVSIREERSFCSCRFCCYVHQWAVKDGKKLFLNLSSFLLLVLMLLCHWNKRQKSFLECFLSELMRQCSLLQDVLQWDWILWWHWCAACSVLLPASLSVPPVNCALCSAQGHLLPCMFSLLLHPDLNGKVSLHACDKEQFFCVSISLFSSWGAKWERNAGFPAGVLVLAGQGDYWTQLRALEFGD